MLTGYVLAHLKANRHLRFFTTLRGRSVAILNGPILSEVNLLQTRYSITLHHGSARRVQEETLSDNLTSLCNLESLEMSPEDDQQLIV